ncbi:MAG: adenosylmethionine decarboxylase [Coprothermobacterota bacterium]|nr:adenosylmethionine decarboxylase [Coprothermobacterota bacterium]
METLGRHILVECSGCNPAVLNDIDAVQEILTEAALAAKAEFRERAFHRFTPLGVSGVIVISESHLSVHTWPEYGYVALDIYTCGSQTMPWTACKLVAAKFGASLVKAMEVKRGMCDEEGHFSHQVVPIQEEEGQSVGAELTMAL